MTKWVGVALVAVSVCVLLGVTLVGLSVYAVVTHVDIEGTDERRAAERFQEIRGRFSGQTPMLTLDGGGSYTPQVSARTDTEPLPKTLAFMKWNPEEERLVSVHLPLWLLRWGTDANVSFDTEDGDLVTLELHVDDLERHGPGLVVDHTHQGRERALVWLE